MNVQLVTPDQWSDGCCNVAGFQCVMGWPLIILADALRYAFGAMIRFHIVNAPASV
jgi:hypothetical protein